jgi:hypothetical protein
VTERDEPSTWTRAALIAVLVVGAAALAAEFSAIAALLGDPR